MLYLKRTPYNMSNFYRKTKHPITGEWEKALWMDMGRNFFVQFPDGKGFSESLHVLEYDDTEEK